MNLFQKYGIKEVADVVFYDITRIGDEEFYTPVLFLDTLKVSTINKSASKVTAAGGYGNKKVISWNFGKEITLNLEDALFSPASMSMIWGGELNLKLSPYTSAIVKLNIANKYGKLHYSTKAFPSPILTDEEWEIVFSAAQEQDYTLNSSSLTAWNFSNGQYEIEDKRFQKEYYMKDDPIIEQNRTELKKRYYKRNWLLSHEEELNKAARKINPNLTAAELEESKQSQQAMPQSVINSILGYINEIKKIGHVETNTYDLEVVDRMEKCVVKDKDGLEISTQQQKENLLKYYQNDRTSSFTIYYDAKTMMPLLNLTDDGLIKGWDAAATNQYNEDNQAISGYDRDFDGIIDEDKFRIKVGTVYYKWSRTVKYKDGANDGILGKTLVIDADTFPNAYKIVGEAYVREQKTGKDQRYQFVIHRAKVSTDTSITLEAEGEPTVFSMNIDVLSPPNDVMIELKQFDVDEDNVYGGTRIIPQSGRHTYTPSIIKSIESIEFTNDEIY